MLSKKDQFGAVIKIVAGAEVPKLRTGQICGFQECISVGPNVRAINAKSPTFRTAMRAGIKTVTMQIEGEMARLPEK